MHAAAPRRLSPSPLRPSLTVASTSICGSGVPTWSGAVTDGGGNCVVETCADTDGNGIPDACQVVSVQGDYGTIQQAIDATPKGSFRIVSVAPGAYAGRDLLHGKAVVVRGAGAGATILQGSGGYFWQCSTQVERTVFRLNSASADGGGLQAYGGALSMVTSTLLDNYANSRGGALHLVEGLPVLTRVDVINNDSNNVAGGVSWVPQGAAASRLVLDDCEVSGNVADVAEGGIGCVDDGGGTKLELRGTRVCTNLPRPNISGPYSADASSEVCDCVADITLDDIVNGVDLAALLSAWGSNGGEEPRADCNRDGLVDGADLGIVLGAWGVCSE